MSQLADRLAPSSPEGFTIPEPLDRAWVEARLDTTVPSVWSVAEPAPFESWVSRMQDER